MNERNTDLFFAVADVIEREPEQYAQRMFVSLPDDCKTTACIAGWACALVDHVGNLTAFQAVAWGLNGERADGAGARKIADRAAELLGLDEDDASVLFSGVWRPHKGLSVPDALRKIGEGAYIRDLMGG